MRKLASMFMLLAGLGLAMPAFAQGAPEAKKPVKGKKVVKAKGAPTKDAPAKEEEAPPKKVVKAKSAPTKDEGTEAPKAPAKKVVKKTVKKSTKVEKEAE